ncbi:hypothetical protein [Pseudodesulfovibrio pelocollis]|uniref:hypothetical protein n=1 Tax=Pseudodesulfovibrio pelocollis TaxID=3051432 RepID=UPI00255AEDFE|nr:hypothetical protein [Pseudodesulfovibrio sp. SB368]
MLMELIEISAESDIRTACSGYCSRCGRVHSLPIGPAVVQARELLRALTSAGRVDLHVDDANADPRLSTAPLFGEARGHMFGVLVCRDQEGRTGVLKAFSGQFNGVWRVPGWVPPLVDTEALASMSGGVERLIKRLGRDMERLAEGSPGRTTLAARRRELSRALMLDIHALYRIPNFRRELKPLPAIVHGEGGIPSGTGDCCAPKLLGYAARHSLTPLGVAEFYLGRENRSGTRRHGGVYASCAHKCGRILGSMLCGLDQA